MASRAAALFQPPAQVQTHANFMHLKKLQRAFKCQSQGSHPLGNSLPANRETRYTRLIRAVAKPALLELRSVRQCSLQQTSETSAWFT